MSIKPQFPVGSSVSHRAFTDCFGEKHEAVTGLTVIESKLVEPSSIPAYYRIKAVGVDGRGYVEAAERFFDLSDKAVIRAFPCSACNDAGGCSVCRTL